jgi:hypothetical protein
MTPCSPASFNLRFGGIYRLHLQGRINKFSKNQLASRWQASLFLLNLFVRPWRWRRYIPPKRRLKLDGLHGIISQKMILFITTATKTSNPKCVVTRLNKHFYEAGKVQHVTNRLGAYLILTRICTEKMHIHSIFALLARVERCTPNWDTLYFILFFQN